MEGRYERSRRMFVLTKIREFYVGKSLLTEEGFASMFRDVKRIRGIGVDWVLPDHVLSVCRHMDLNDHFEALSVGIGMPYNGIEALLENLIELELEPPTILNRTVFYRPPKAPRLLGELLVELGLLDVQTLQRGLGIKTLIQHGVGVDAAVGQVVRCISSLSIVDLFQALAIQTGIPFESLDTSAPQIFAAAMQRELPTPGGAGAPNRLKPG